VESPFVPALSERREDLPRLVKRQGVDVLDYEDDPAGSLHHPLANEVQYALGDSALRARPCGLVDAKEGSKLAQQRMDAKVSANRKTQMHDIRLVRASALRDSPFDLVEDEALSNLGGAYKGKVILLQDSLGYLFK
jgi:hypothetical protein